MASLACKANPCCFGSISYTGGVLHFKAKMTPFKYVHIFILNAYILQIYLTWPIMGIIIHFHLQCQWLGLMSPSGRSVSECGCCLHCVCLPTSVLTQRHMELQETVQACLCLRFMGKILFSLYVSLWNPDERHIYSVTLFLFFNFQLKRVRS